jgi:hypothetical protein
MILMRYADDIVVGFEHEADARRFWDDMRKRFEGFSLSLNPDKTPPDRVRPLCGRTTSSAPARKTGDLQLSRLHLHLANVTVVDSSS